MKIQDRSQQLFTLAGILTFTDKVIDREAANKIRRAIEMTQVAMIFEEEKQQAVRQAVEAERKKAADSVKAERKKAADSVKAERKKAADSVKAERKKAADSVKAERKKAADSEKQVVIKMIEKGYSTEEIAFLVSNYTKNDVEALRKKIMKGNFK